jgi:hypothetical protein
VTFDPDDPFPADDPLFPTRFDTARHSDEEIAKSWPAGFRAKVQFGDGCWNWTGGASGSRGQYGKFYWLGRHRGAHQLAYEWSRGPIPGDLQIDHLCRNTRCCRPSHLEAVTHLENVRRHFGWRPDVCGRGHPRTEANTFTVAWRPGGLGCRICHREDKRRYRASLRAAGGGALP